MSDWAIDKRIQSGWSPLAANFDPILSLPLCPVHGLVGEMHKGVHTFAFTRKGEDSDADGDPHRLSIDQERFGKYRHQLSGHLLGLLRLVKIGKQNHKFISPNPGYCICGTYGSAETRGDFSEHCVARLMAHGIVDLLEPI